MKKRIQSIMGLLNLGLLFSSTGAHAEEIKKNDLIPSPVKIQVSEDGRKSGLVISLEEKKLIQIIESAISTDCGRGPCISKKSK